MTELVAGKRAYTLNNDGTIEDWYVERPYYQEQVILRKKPTPCWYDTIRGFAPQNVYPTQRAAKAALKARMNNA